MRRLLAYTGVGVGVILALVLFRLTLYSPADEVGRLLNNVRFHVWEGAHPEEYQTSLNKALALDPEHPELLLYSGYAHLQQSQATEAIAPLEKGLALSAEDEILNAHIRLNLTQAYMTTGRYPQALNLLVGMLQFNPPYIDYCLEQTGQILAVLFGAESPCRKAEARRFLTALQLYQKGLYSVALMTLSEGEAEPFVLYLQALSYQRSGKLNQASQALAQALVQTSDLSLVFGIFPDLADLIPLFPVPQDAQWALDQGKQ